MAEQYKIDLGVKLNDQQLNTVKTTINTLVDKERKINLDIDFNIKNANKLADIGREIETLKEQLREIADIDFVGKGKGKGKSVLSVDSEALKKSINTIHNDILKIQNAFGKVDKNKGTQSLLTTVNKIRAALEGVTKQFEGLNKSLSALSGKDFNLNLDLGLGASKKDPTQLMRELRVLEKEAREYENYIYKVLNKTNKIDGTQARNSIYDLAFKVGKNDTRTYLMDLDKMMSGGSNSNKVAAYKEYIRVIKELSSIGNITLSPVESRLAESGDFVKVKNEANEAKNAIKELFGSGINGEALTKQLDDIVLSLMEIQKTLRGLSSGVSIEGLTQSFDKLSDTIEKLVSNAGTVKNTLGGTVSNTTVISNATQNFKAMDAAIENAQGEAKGLENALRQMGVADANIEKITQQVDSLGVTAQKVSGSFNKDGSFSIKVTGVKELNDNLEQTAILIQKFGKDGSAGNLTTTLTEDLRKASAAFEELKTKADKLSTSASISNVDKQYVGTASALQRLSRVVPNVQNSFDALKATYKELTSAQQNYNNIASQSDATDEQKIDAMKRLIGANEKYQDVLATTNNFIAKQSKIENANNNSSALTVAKADALSRLEGLFEKGSKAAKIYATRVEELRREINECGSTTEIGILNKQISTLGREIDNAKIKTQTFGQSLRDQWEQYKSYLSVASLISYGTQALRSMFEQVKLIDSAMTELKKVTNETDAAYNNFLRNAADRAKKIGTTIDGLVGSTADFARLGYGFKDAQGLAEVANIYAVVGDEIEGVEGATESLISTMAAFKGEMNGMSNADFAMSIIDKFNEIKFYLSPYTVMYM